MSVLIRDIDSETYAKLKAKAAEKGLKVGEAVTEAMREWIKSSKSDDPAEVERMKNLATFRRVRSSLETAYRGKWCLISNGEVVMIADSLEGIAKGLEERKLAGKPCLIFKVGEPPMRKSLSFGRRITR